MSQESTLQVVAEEVKQTPQLTPEEEAVLYIQQGSKLFDEMVDKVTGVQAKRVLEAVIKSPFEDVKKQLSTKEAAMLYELCDRIQIKKFLLFQMSLEQQIFEAVKAEENKINVDTAQEVSNMENKGE